MGHQASPSGDRVDPQSAAQCLPPQDGLNPCSVVASRMPAAARDACLSSMPLFPTVGSSAACRASILQPPDVPNSLVVGKNAGNFADSAVPCEQPSRKLLQMQWFADEFPTHQSREFFRASRELIPLCREFARKRSA